MFTRIALRKIESLKDARKEKLKVKAKILAEPPLCIAVEFSFNEKIMYDLFEIVAHNQGRRELKILIKSKLGDIELDTGFKVHSNIINLIKPLNGAYIIE